MKEIYLKYIFFFNTNENADHIINKYSTINRYDQIKKIN